jgi:uncharacterized protein YbjT (DUF2867 family)
MKTALIAGATGLVGKACLYQLLENNEYSRVVALVRRPIAIKHPKLHQVIVDFDNLEKHKSEIVADAVFCCLGTTIKVAGSQENFRKVDHDYPLAIATIAFNNGATQFLLVSALGANKNSSIFYNRVKGEIESAIIQLGYPTVNIFRPSLLLGHRNQFRLGEMIGKIVMRVVRILLIGPLSKYKAIADITVAKAMVRISLNNETGIHIYPNNMIQKIGS